MDLVRTNTTVGVIERGPAGQLTLRYDEVHIWQADLAALACAKEPWTNSLSADECARMLRFRFEQDRRRFATARCCLRLLLGAYLNLHPAEVSFRYSANGKPALEETQSVAGLAFNVSHSDTMALFAFTRGRAIGVDVERLRGDFDTDSIAERFFSLRERESLISLPPHDRPAAFFHCWARKEAFVKARGEGLSLPLNQFDVSLVPGYPADILATRPDAQERDRWLMWAPAIAPDYAAALVVQKTEESPLRLLHFCLNYQACDFLIAPCGIDAEKG